MSLFEITDLPTMYVDGRIYVGKEAFDWLNSKNEAPMKTLPTPATLPPPYSSITISEL